MGHKSAQSAPHQVPGVRLDAGLFFQGWSREGRWIGGCLLNERSEIIFGQPTRELLEAQIIAAQLTQRTIVKASQEARTATQTKIRFRIPVFGET